jgi:hypothetical protein
LGFVLIFFLAKEQSFDFESLNLNKKSSEKQNVKYSPDGSGILLWSGSGARDIADSRTK